MNNLEQRTMEIMCGSLPKISERLDEISSSLKGIRLAIEDKHICCICGKTFSGYGNNPQPYKQNGVCCDECNAEHVIPERLKA